MVKMAVAQVANVITVTWFSYGWPWEDPALWYVWRRWGGECHGHVRGCRYANAPASLFAVIAVTVLQVRERSRVAAVVCEERMTGRLYATVYCFGRGNVVRERAPSAESRRGA